MGRPPGFKDFGITLADRLNKTCRHGQPVHFPMPYHRRKNVVIISAEGGCLANILTQIVSLENSMEF